MPARSPEGRPSVKWIRTIAARAVAVLLSLPAVAASQNHTLVVSVADDADGRPLADATVTLVGLARGARTDWIGEARFSDLPARRLRVQVRMLGYAPAELEMPIHGDSSAAIFMLEQAPRQLDKVTVTATSVDTRLAEVELHRRLGIARILDESALAREGHQPIFVVLISHFAGLMPATVESSGRDSVVAAMHGGLLFSVVPTCPVAVYVDGFWSPGGLEGIRTEELRGVEYYSTESAPPQYRRAGKACKVLLFWTKPY